MGKIRHSKSGFKRPFLAMATLICCVVNPPHTEDMAGHIFSLGENYESH